MKNNNVGYDRKVENLQYFTITIDGYGEFKSTPVEEEKNTGDNSRYEEANYFTDDYLTEHRVKLFSCLNQMFRWAAENTAPVTDKTQEVYVVEYMKDRDQLVVQFCFNSYSMLPRFATSKDCEAFISEFYNELLFCLRDFRYRVEVEKRFY